MDQITRMVDTSAAAAVWDSLKESPHDDETLARLCVNVVLQSIGPRVLEPVTAALCARDVDGCAPNRAKSSAEKAHGLAAFRTGDLAQASSAFTTALANLDELEVPDLAAALYLNRAAIDLKEGRAERVVANCNCALECEAGNAKALYRRAQARAALGDGEGARADVEALRLSGKATDQEADALLEHIVSQAGANAPSTSQGSDGGRMEAPPDDMHESDVGRKGAPPDDTHESDVGRKGAPQDDMHESDVGRKGAPPDTSNGGIHSLRATAQLRVERSDVKGCYLVVEGDVQCGDLLLAERPLAMALTKQTRAAGQVCWRCLAALPEGGYFPCRACPLARYCCPECREADNSHVPRGPLCGVPWPSLLPAEVVLATRLAAQGRQECLGVEKCDADVAELESHVCHMTWRQLAPLLAQSLLAAECWARCAGTRHGSPSAHHILLGLCKVRVNGIAIVPGMHRRSEGAVALALYKRASRMNHACRPNVAVSFQGAQIIVRAAADLAAGTPLLHCYGPQAGEMVTAVRRKLLAKQYHFTCDCSECGDGAAADAAVVGLRCACCDGAVLPSVACPAGLCSLHALPPAMPGSGTCFRCGRVMLQRDQLAVLQTLKSAADHFEAAKSLTATGSMEDAVCCFDICLKEQQQVLYSTNQLIGRTHHALAGASAAAYGAQMSNGGPCDLLLSSNVLAHSPSMTTGYVSAALHHADTARRIIAANYGQGSVQVANQDLLWSELLRVVGLSKEAHRLERNACSILHLLHGFPAKSLD